MEELCQPTLNGRGGPIPPIAIKATNFGLKNDMIQQVQNSCQFYGLPGDDANKHLDKFLHLPRNSITTFEQMAKMFLRKYFLPSMVTKLRNEITNFRQRPDDSLFKAWERYDLSIDRCPNHNITFMKRHPKECYDLIENMAVHHNDWDTSVQRSESSNSITSSSDPEIVALKAEMAEINKNLMKVLQINQQVKAVTHSCETCGGPHSYKDCPATVGQTQNVYAARAYNQGGNSYQPQDNRNLLSYRSDNYLGPPRFNQNQNRRASHGQNLPPAYQAPAYQASGYQAPIQQTSIPQPNTITNLKEDLKGITTRSGIAYKGPTIPITSSPPKVVERKNQGDKGHVEAPVSALKPIPKLTITYPSRLHDQKLREKANDQMEKFFQDLNFNISFADALILMPKFALTIKSLLTNKEKLFELARIPLNEHCSAVLLKKLPEKLGDPANFSSRTERALIDVYEGELTLHVGNKVVTFNLDQTLRYSANYDDESINRIDVIDVACKEYSQEVIVFSVSSNPTSSTERIISTSSLTLTPIEDKLKVVEPKNKKSSIDEPPVVELKDLPPHLEYAFLEGDDKLPVIIAKDLKDQEKTALKKVLKSHKQALTWQLSDIKGINLKFCTHKILIEDDFKPAVQHERKVNPKIHEVIKKEVLKLLDSGFIYTISDIPWVSLVYCVPKKGGFTVLDNEENELIPTRLITR
uniref:Reverse transcriptase domain-containing protein n=1 Tax=Tanacetum cinerariifolium TaxID=118510 RepID=A0A699GPN2_TANCI|nr:reverse transcriptase domain-containing protein [Tanacetum cinerariifolium]